ncbi:hypothetical protein PG989_015321 [Apiospora arundinis]
MTYGKEIEFLGRHLEIDDDEDDLQRMKEAYPGVVIIPLSEDFHDLAIQEDYAKTLSLNGIDVNPVRVPGRPLTRVNERTVVPHPNAEYTNLSGSHRWTVDEDVSVGATVEEALQERAAPGERKLQWYGLELISPANANTDASHQELHDVLRILRNKYGDCMRVNVKCGLHIHVGMGPNAIPVGELRRIAAFLYVVDPILAILHPEHRQDNFHCPSIRQRSQVTWGMTAAIAEDFDEERDGGPWKMQQRGQQPTPLRDAVQELLSCASGHAVYRLLQYRNSVNNYNFNNYYNANYTVRPELEGRVTIEFRQHEGTLDPARIEAWARLCVGLTEWAAFDMTVNQLLQIIAAVEMVEQQTPWGPLERVGPRWEVLRQLLELAGLGRLVTHYSTQLQRQRRI